MPLSDSFTALEVMVRILMFNYLKQYYLSQNNENAKVYGYGLRMVCRSIFCKTPVLFLRICKKVSREHILHL